MSDLHNITYRLPGGLVLTYGTTIPTFQARLRHTIGGAIAIWRMWLREARHLMLSGQVPYPSVIALNVAGDISRAFRRFQWEAAIARPGQGQDGADGVSPPVGAPRD